MRINNGLGLIAILMTGLAIPPIGLVGALAGRGSSASAEKSFPRESEQKEHPNISKALIQGKDLRVFGENFDEGARILIDDDIVNTKRDSNRPDTELIAKKARKRFLPEQIIKIRVQNSDGQVSEPLSFYTGCA